MNRYRIVFVTLAFFLPAWTGRSDAAVAPPGPPVNLRAKPQSTTALLLEWRDTATNETRFRVERLQGVNSYVFVRNVGANKQSVVLTGLSSGVIYHFRVRAENAGGFSAWSELASANTDTQSPPSACAETPFALCLGSGSERFRVEVQFRGSPGGALQSLAGTEFNSESGYFYFSEGTPSLDLVVRVLNGCGPNGRHWVFVSGTTTPETLVTVTDTQTGRGRRYLNPVGPLTTIHDTSAFATCP